MKVKLIGAVVATITALSLVATALPAAADGSSVNVEEMLPMLATPQTALDLVPKEVTLDSLGEIDADSVRAIGSDGVADYWVARSGTSQVCLILYIPGGNEVSASTCASLAHFYRAGMGLIAGESMTDPSRSTEVYLLPADINPSDLLVRMDSSPLPKISANLLSMRPSNSLRPADLSRMDGSIFNFNPITLQANNAWSK